MRVLGLVPARAGSKGIPGKNLRPLAGRPLLAYTAEAARRSQNLSTILLSTDDPEIAEVGRGLGMWAPFLRPADLARDDTPMFPVVVHALEWLETHGERYDAVCLLQPTSPLRRGEDVDGCIALLERSEVDSVVTVLPVPARHNPHWAYLADPDGYLRLAVGASQPLPRRQELPPAFHREGSVYVTRVATIETGHNLYGERILPYTVAAERSVNLDEEADWVRAERLLRENEL